MPVSGFLTKEQRKSLQKAIKEDECSHFREVTVPETTLAERSRSQNPARTLLRLRSGDGYSENMSWSCCLPTMAKLNNRLPISGV